MTEMSPKERKAIDKFIIETCHEIYTDRFRLALERARDVAEHVAHEAEITKQPDCQRCEVRNGHLYRCSYHEGWDEAAVHIAHNICSLTLDELLEEK